MKKVTLAEQITCMERLINEAPGLFPKKGSFTCIQLEAVLTTLRLIETLSTNNLQTLGQNLTNKSEERKQGKNGKP